mgnify:CR=1 FL=1
MKLRLRVSDDFSLVPVDDDGIKYLYKRNVGDILDGNIVFARNPAFHRKAFALVKVVHDALPEPEPIMLKGELIQPIRTLENTREFLTILAGHYDVVGLPNGKVRAEARSWSFAKMDQPEFEAFYSTLIDASLKALPDTWTEDELNRVATNVINFL